MIESEKDLRYQDSLNESEWHNAANWWWGILYHSQLDDRIWVPKRSPSFGLTINLARPFGLAIGLAIPVALVALIVTAALRR
jgi:uncharacterized membrane protein